jgi:GAF domain-containing protein
MCDDGDLDSFLDVAVRVTASAMRADSCAIFLIDQSRRTLTQRAGFGAQAPGKVIRSYMMADRDKVEACISTSLCDPGTCQHRHSVPREEKLGLTSWIAATGKSFHASNHLALRNHCHWRGQFEPVNYTRKEECGAWLGAPLRVAESITGVLQVERLALCGATSSNGFSATARQQFEVLAERVALAIMRLYERGYELALSLATRDAQKAIAEIVRGGRSVRDTVETIVNVTAELLKARVCAVFLKEGNRLIQPLWAAHGWARRGPSVREYALVREEDIEDHPACFEDKVGLTAWIAAKRRTFIARSNLELRCHPHHIGKYDSCDFAADERCESFMGTALLIEGNVIGVLKVETKMKSVGQDEEVFSYFNERDECVFDLIAHSAAQAIQNALRLDAQRPAD